MENQKMNSLKIFNQQQQNINSTTNENKFKKINNSSTQQNDLIYQHKIYDDTLKQCQGLNEHIFEIGRFDNPSVIFNNQSCINKDDIQEPFRPQIKVRINVEKGSSMIRAKSQHQDIVTLKRHLSIGRGKVHTATRFSNQSSQKQKNNSIKNTDKDLDISNRKQISNNSNVPINQNQTTTKNSINKKVRVKSSSVVSLSAKVNQQKKFKKCIPLKQFKAKQPQSFFQNIYRIKRQNLQLWKSDSHHWTSQENFYKNKTKMTMNPKQMKKIVFQGYDFDGQLIPSFFASQKQKKSIEQNSKIEVQPLNEFSVQNLTNYNERKPTKVKTIKHVKFQHTQLNQTESQFLKNFRNLQWNQNIGHVQIKENDSQQVSKQIMELISSKKLKQYPSIKMIQNDNNSRDIETNKRHNYQELISRFEKVKQNTLDTQINQNNKFEIGFSKFVKAKKFLQKQTKSKSYNYQTYKYLPLEVQSQNENNSTIKIKQSQKKGPQKVRANKRLFKQIFNVSLKNIQPGNRQDIATIKLIQDRQKQNMEAQVKQKQQKQSKAKITRKSDTVLFKKGFQMKVKFLNQLSKNSKSQFFKPSQNSQSKRNQVENHQIYSQFSIKEDSIQQSSYLRFSEASNPSISKRKINFSIERKSLVNFTEKNNSTNLQKLFKKDTKKVLFKHSVHEIRKQNFQ